MEEVIRFFEMHHKGKYKVYNLCSERLYDASLLRERLHAFLLTIIIVLRYNLSYHFAKVHTHG
eukprot:UN08440